MTLPGALLLIDLMLGGSLVGASVATPPSAPLIGALYRIAASGATDAFVGREGQLAGWTPAGWRFTEPFEGLQLTIRGSGLTIRYHDGAWIEGAVRASSVIIAEKQVVGPRQPAVTAPSGGSVIDAEARSAMLGILSAMRAHGLIEP